MKIIMWKTCVEKYNTSLSVRSSAQVYWYKPESYVGTCIFHNYKKQSFKIAMFLHVHTHLKNKKALNAKSMLQNLANKTCSVDLLK